MDGETFDPERLRSAPIASLESMSTSPSGDDSDGSGRCSSFGFQPRSPVTPPQSRRTGSVDAMDVARDGSRFGFQKRRSHTRSASTEPTWHTDENETRPKSSFGYQTQQYNTPQLGASPAGGTQLGGAKPRSSFGYQPRQLRRVEKACETRVDRGNGNDEVTHRKNFGYQPRRQEAAQGGRDADLKNEMNGVVKLGDSTAGKSEEQSTPHERPGHHISGVQQKENGTVSEDNPQLLSEREDAPTALLQDAGCQDVGFTVQEEQGKRSSEGGTPVACGQRMEDLGQEFDDSHHSQLSSGAGSVGAQPMHATTASVVNDQSNKALGDDDDCVKYEYTALRTEEVVIKHPCMADQPAQPPGVHAAMSTQDRHERLKRVEEFFSGNCVKYHSRTPESQVALQYASELLDSTPKAVEPNIAPSVTSAEESASDGEADVPQGDFPFSYMTGFNTNWMDSGSDSGSEQTRAYAMKSERNKHTESAAGGDGHCPSVQVKASKEKYKMDEMDLDSSSDDYVLEETDVVLQNLLSDQSAPQTPSVEEGRRTFLQASNMSVRSTLTESPSVDSQREEAAVLLQKLMTRSSMTSRSAEEDCNSLCDKRGATRMSLLSRSSGRSGGWDEPMEGANEEVDEGSSDGPGIEAALQKLMVSVHRMNEEVRDGSTAEKTVSSWLQEDKPGVAAKLEDANDIADVKLKSVAKGSTMEAVVLDGSVQGTLQELQPNNVGHPIVLDKPSCPSSKDTSTLDDASGRKPVSSAGHTTWEAVEHKNPCPALADVEVGEMGSHGPLQGISIDADDQAELYGEVTQSGQVKDVSVVPLSMQFAGEEFGCDVGQVGDHGALQEIIFAADDQAVLAEEATQSGKVQDDSVAPIPMQFEGQQIGCDVVILTARDIVDASAPTAACDEQCAPSSGHEHASSGLGSISEISEILSVDGEFEASPEPMDISLHVPTKELLPTLTKDSGNGCDQEEPPPPVDAQPTTVSRAVTMILGKDRHLETSSHPLDPPCAAAGGHPAVLSEENGVHNGSDCSPSPIDLQPAKVTSAVPEAMDENCDHEASPSPVGKPPCVALSGLHAALNEDGDDNSSCERSPCPMDVHVTAAPVLMHEIVNEESDREASPPPMDIPPYVATKGLSALFNEDSGDESDHEDAPSSMDAKLTVKLGIAAEAMSNSSESQLSPLPHERDLILEQPHKEEESKASPEPRTPNSAPPVHRRAMDLPLQFDKEWMAATCLATKPRISLTSSETSHTGPICARFRGFSCDRALTLNYDDEDYVLARAAAASRMSVDFANVAMHPPRTSFSTFSFAASADPAINKRLPCTRLMRRRLDLVMRMQEQWHFGRRPAEWRRYQSDVQDARNWAQPVLKVLSSPIRGISHIGNGIVSKIANVFGFGKAGQ